MPEPHRNADFLPPAAITAALRLVGAVRDRDRSLVRQLTRCRCSCDCGCRTLAATLVTLAAMIPDDLSPAALLAWTETPTVADPEPPDLDEAAVIRAAAGDLTVPLTRAEMHAAWSRLEQQSLPGELVAAALGVSGETIRRWRAGDCSPSARRAARNLRVVGA